LAAISSLPYLDFSSKLCCRFGLSR